MLSSAQPEARLADVRYRAAQVEGCCGLTCSDEQQGYEGVHGHAAADQGPHIDAHQAEGQDIQLCGHKQCVRGSTRFGRGQACAWGGREVLLGQRATVAAMIVLSAKCIALLLSAALSLMSCSSRASLRKLLSLREEGCMGSCTYLCTRSTTYGFLQDCKVQHRHRL